jgi:hypothetical protein
MIYLYIYNSVTAYPIQDDALKTGELDYVNGGIREFIMLLNSTCYFLKLLTDSIILFLTVCHYFSCTCSFFHSRKLPRTSCCHCPRRVIFSFSYIILAPYVILFIQVFRCYLYAMCLFLCFTFHRLGMINRVCLLVFSLSEGLGRKQH